MIILEIAPRDVNETTALRDATVMSEVLLFSRGERASRNGFRKLDALQSVARSGLRLPADDWPFPRAHGAGWPGKGTRVLLLGEQNRTEARNSRGKRPRRIVDAVKRLRAAVRSTWT